MNKLVLLLLTLFPILGWAVQDLPELSGQTDIGRITLYKSVSGTSWYTPTGFSSQFSCVGMGAERSCFLRVFNGLTDQEHAVLTDLETRENLSITYFTDVDSQVVTGIAEQFTGLPAGLNGQTMLLKTLHLGKTMYAQYAFRASADIADRLLTEYSSGAGLGDFEVDFTMQGQRTVSYAGLNDGACVKDAFLAQAKTPLSRRQVSDLLNGVLANCQFRSLGMDQAEQFARYNLRQNYLNYSFWTGYSVNAEEVEKIQDRVVLNDVVSDPVSLHCHARLHLQNNSMPQFQCQ